jgi:ABC-type branched-subunit amino acid transport system substrate-binding protein
MTKRRLFYLGVVAVVLMLALRITYAQTQPVFRIGVLDEELGPISNGARLAVQEINQAGGVRGADGTFFQLELVIQPIGGGAGLNSAINSLTAASVVAVLGPEDSDIVLNNMAGLQQLNVPVLTSATGDTILTSDTSRRLFRSRAAEVLQGRALANYLVNDLQLQSIAAVQLDLDINTSAALIGFSTASAALGREPIVLTGQNSDSIPQIVNQIILNPPEIVATYGNQADAVTFYNQLLEAGYTGFFAYNLADTLSFQNALSLNKLQGIISTTTWPSGAGDVASIVFRNNFIRLYGQVPGPVEAASYDSVYLLAQAIGVPGELQNNLAQVNDLRGVQGLLDPAGLSRGETSENVAVIRLNPFGGADILARYQGNQRITDEELNGPLPTATPAATATPQGVVATITRTIQNVRSGPGTFYPIIGELGLGEQVQVIGANTDFSWLVISFRGGQGWLSRGILDVFGDLNTLPIITPPPTPTLPPTTTPQPAPDIVIDAASGAPAPFITNQAFTVSVTVRNAGGGPAGQFAVAATFPPNNVFGSAIVPGLAPGQTMVVNLTGTFTNTGFYSVVIVSDLNGEVAESNETNNTFTYSYGINRPIMRQGSQALNPGDTIDLEGNGVQGDANWDGSALNALFGARIAVIPNVTVSTVHYDLIDPGIVNQTSIANASLVPGTVIGIITADGNRGVIRVDNLGGQLSLTFIVYQT